MPKVKTPKRRRGWVFTLNNPTPDDISFFAAGPFRGSCTHFVAQLEAGVDGTPHIQGFVRFEHAKAFTVVKKLLRAAHIEAALGSCLDNYKYCTKPEGHINGPWSHGAWPVQRVLPTDLWPWQTAATALIAQEPNDRTIFWFWEAPGGVGKSILQWIWERDYAAVLVGHKAGDVRCAIKLAWCHDGRRERCAPPHPVIMLNLPRGTQCPALFEVLEELKDGLFFSGKYKSSMVKLPLCQVAVFANEPPLHSTLSVDKLKVARIDGVEAASKLIFEGDPEYESVGFNPHGS